MTPPSNPLVQFQKYLDGNPAMHEIVQQAFQRMKNNQPFDDVQVTVMEEWYRRAGQRLRQLEDESQRDMLTTQKYEEMSYLSQVVPLVRDFIKRKDEVDAATPSAISTDGQTESQEGPPGSV